MKKTVDIGIVGGGIIGLATAYYLQQQGQSTTIAIFDKKYMGSGSTGRCIGGIRQQFSTPASIQMMKENIDLFAQMEEEFGLGVEFHQGGYLLLAHNDELKQTFINNIKIQQQQGVDVSLLSPEEAQKVVPHLNIDGVRAAAYCPDDAQAFPFAVLRGYKKKILENGGDVYVYNPVEDIKKDGNFSITLRDGTVIETGKVLLSAGPWTGELSEKLGLELPLFPERHEALITERMPRFMEPMLVDYRQDGCYFQQMTGGQIIGCYTPHPNVPGIHEDTSFEFVPHMAWRMSRLVPSLQNAAILRHWSGSYTMTPDGNPIVDRTPVDNLYVASGMSGHGFMFGPAVGKHLAHYMLQDEWDTDFSEFAINRSFTSKEKLK